MGQEEKEVNTASLVRTRLAQIEVLPGRPWENTSKMLDWIRAARGDGEELIVFPELAVPGYLIADEWERDAFLRECEDCGHALREAARDIVVIFGNVALDRARRNEDGRVRKYNALFVAEDGRFVGPARNPYDFVIKTLLPNYREFDDSRHFFDLRKLALEQKVPVEALLAPVQTRRFSLGGLICEDLWDSDYSISPLEILSRSSPDLYVNISSSPFTLNKNHKRRRVFSAHARQLGRPLIFVNNVGIQNNGKTVFTFDGASCVYDGNGSIAAAAGLFAESPLSCPIPLGGAAFGKPAFPAEDDVGVLHAAVEYGTRRFMDLCGASRVTIGASGGIDSALAAALYSRITGPENLLLLNMPSRHNSPTTRRLAADLAASLGCFYAEVPIDGSVRLTASQIGGLTVRDAAGRRSCTLQLSPFMLENVQARDRSSRVLAAAAAAFGGVFTCNTNKSEATVGYGTLYGDITGFLANLGDLWKMEVYALARHLNGAVFGREVIPAGCFDVKPSAELSPDQNVDEGKGDPLAYPYHDRLFQSWVEWWNRVTPEEILAWYAEGTLESRLEYGGRISDLFADARAFVADLERWWNLYQGMGVAKRIQAPPVLAVKRRAFGFDHREAQMGPRYTKRYLALREQLLQRA